MSTRGVYPAWKGFERSPEGRLLAQIVEIAGPMGLAYERSVGFKKDFHVHDRDMLVCPRGASAMRVTTRGSVTTSASTRSRSFDVDDDSILFVPKTCEHDDASLTAVYDTVALYPNGALLEKAARAAGLSRRAVDEVVAQPFALARSHSFADALERYFTARVLERARSSAQLRFLELELVVEVLRLATTRATESARALPKGEREPLLERAVRAIESSLFSPLDLASLGRRVGASTSTLLRCFRRELDTTPYAYAKARRLDEALRLLKSGGVQVKEVALLVGYDDLPSFSKAFRSRFAAPPSDFLVRPSASPPSSRDRAGTAS